MALAWAKLPSAWLKLRQADEVCPLRELEWRGHRTTGTACLVLLMALAVRLNISRRGRELEEGGTKVAMTYTEINKLTGFARATIAQAISLLEGMGAIRVRKEGRHNVYELMGVNEPGKWCQLPQEYLMDGGTLALKRLKGLTGNRVSLNSMKLYVLLLALRERHFNTTAISYDGIVRHTGMRREDIPSSLSQLSSLQLVRVTDDLDDRPEDHSHRYRVLGLRPSQ